MKRLKDLLGAECAHDHTLVVTAAGVRRTVCEGCGNVSFKMVARTATTPRKAKASHKLRKVSGL